MGKWTSQNITQVTNLANYLTVILIVLGVWLSGLSVVFYLILRHYRRLVKGAGKYDLKKVLDKILDLVDKNSKNISSLEKETRFLRDEGLNYVQRMGLVRFNPFNETGGDHSFSLAVLNGKNSGFVITALHTRERTRVYLKSLKDGKTEYELSNEEKKAISKALKD